MRAVVMQGLHRPLALETLPDPTPEAGEVVVKVGRCGICGSDLHMTEDASYGMGAGSVLGHEFSGEVVALGKGVEGLAKGDLVAVSPLKSCGHCPACVAGQGLWWCKMWPPINQTARWPWGRPALSPISMTPLARRNGRWVARRIL
jgi:(R,R)-butanediol dehydrogenase/meso-butanediol dehydrogenase/diacetyl reductase